MRIINAEGRILYERVIALFMERDYPVAMPRSRKLSDWKIAAEEAVAWMNANTSFNLTLLPRGLDMGPPKLSAVSQPTGKRTSNG